MARIGRAAALALVCAVGLACEGVGDDPEDAEPIGLAAAIEIAQDDIPEGLPIDAELTEFEGEPAYDVDLFFDGETRELFVDAYDGEIVGRAIDPDDFADGEAAAVALEASEVSLLEAIDVAEGLVDGEAVAAELDDTFSVIEVVMVMDTDTRVVLVSLDDGSATIE